MTNFTLTGLYTDLDLEDDDLLVEFKAPWWCRGPWWLKSRLAIVYMNHCFKKNNIDASVRRAK